MGVLAPRLRMLDGVADPTIHMSNKNSAHLIQKKHHFVLPATPKGSTLSSIAQYEEQEYSCLLEVVEHIYLGEHHHVSSM